MSHGAAVHDPDPGSTALDDRSYAEFMHGRLTGRAIDPATLRHVLGLLASGTPRDELAIALQMTVSASEALSTQSAAPTLALMLACPPAEFIAHAFKHLLGRSPDLGGALVYLRALRGRKGRLAILVALRFSEEGLAHGSLCERPWTVREMLRTPYAAWPERLRLLACRQVWWRRN